MKSAGSNLQQVVQSLSRDLLGRGWLIGLSFFIFTLLSQSFGLHRLGLVVCNHNHNHIHHRYNTCLFKLTQPTLHVLVSITFMQNRCDHLRVPAGQFTNILLQDIEIIRPLQGLLPEPR